MNGSQSVFNYWLKPAQARFLIIYLDFRKIIVKLSRTRPSWD